MHCPFCHHPDSRVVDTRIADDGASIRRRRECTACKKRFTTLETSSFQVVKRSGVVEPFSRNKVVSGLKQACQGRPVSDDQLALLAQQVEEKLRSSGFSNVSSDEVGKAILPFLQELDEVAYLRFASVYRDFGSVDDFIDAIEVLRGRQSEQAPTKAPRRKRRTTRTNATKGQAQATQASLLDA
ncbi:transcriptional repressor NrdR [Schaalia sp. 19OD2882]|uniref:transcriptional regulator NrdR n=1 Tax=Schaalia sp. 19OD2882 TaxID=2794089 RepID=UPI001C1EF576|nr:transcriptional regulator NrdR [Schaalia sp. 19OD2882]QWW18953.1 transcriptional repressor NrdR [Schaalia sp. 19OD2882]